MAREADEPIRAEPAIFSKTKHGTAELSLANPKATQLTNWHTPNKLPQP
jgi:hypothetical protein